MPKLLICVLLLSFFVLASMAAQPDEADELGPSVNLIPRVRLDAHSDMKVEMLFENDSNDVIHYLFESDSHPVRRLLFVLLKAGAAKSPVESKGSMMLDADAVRALPPQKHLVHMLDLRKTYGELEPGQYMLEARLNGQPRDFGLTQLRFRKTVLHIEVVRDAKRE